MTKKQFLLGTALLTLFGCGGDRTDYVYSEALQQAGKSCADHGGVLWYKLEDGMIVSVRCNNDALIDRLWIRS